MRPAALLSPRTATIVVALVGVALRVPFVGSALSSDEAGFLMVGGQWSPGTSLYGDYWVDRPPLLIGIYQLAHALGGAVALRLLGILVLLVCAALGALIGRLVTEWKWAPPVIAAVPALLMSDVLYGATEVNGELLAMPFVLGGVYAVLRAVLASVSDVGTPRTRPAWVAAGVLAVLAASVKQSMFDVFIGAAVALVWLAVRRRWRPALDALACFVVGAAVAGLSIVGWAALNGTRPGALFQAVVTFRGQAAEVIASEASSATSERAHLLLEAFLLSGAWGIGLLAAVSLAIWFVRRRTGEADTSVMPFVWIAAAIVAWETFGVLAGGSYWLHYLIGTVPGSTLLAAAFVRAQQLRVRWLLADLCFVAMVAVPAAVEAHANPPTDTDAAVADYLSAHSHRGDSAVVAFGHPNIVEDTGLSDPYVNLWSLPVRVRDPDLVRFTRVLREDRPTWVVVAGPTIDTWAINADRANAVLVRDYHPVTHIGSWYLYRRDPSTR